MLTLPFRALVIEDDADSALFSQTALRQLAGMEVEIAADAQQALTALAARSFDIIVTDIEMPGRSGLEILPQIRELQPGVPVLVLTAHGNLTYAVEALRQAADDFLVKPIRPAELADRARELADLGRTRRAGNRLAVLAIGAHPDDVEIGVGGTLAAHQAAGDRLAILTLSGGAIGGEASVRQEEALRAADSVGAELVHLDFEDTLLDPAKGVISAVEKVIAQVQPDLIYTHSPHDRHQDHRAVNESVQIAARQVAGLWCFRARSCTVDFTPNRFVDITGFVDRKLEMLAAYASQKHRDYMQADMVRATARYWSRFSQAIDVEPLETIRAAVTVGPPTPVGRPNRTS